MFDLPTYREPVDKAVSVEDLKAVAWRTTDPQVLLGLAFLARVGSPVRQEISEMAVKARTEYAPLVAVLAIAMDAIDEQSIGELIRRDPDNALGYYLQGKLLYDSDRDIEALEEFRKAAHCSELRLYESVTGDALFKALDALKLQGRDRLCALGWMASRSSNFTSVGLQPLQHALSELARSGDTARREDISDLLLVLAGHLFATNFVARQFAQWTLLSAFGLKAEIASDNPQKKHGYEAAAQALASTFDGWPGIDDRLKTLNSVQFLPDRIHRAFAMTDPSKRRMHGYMNVNPPKDDRTAFERAIENAATAAAALIEVVLTDPDGIVGAYLRGLPPRRQDTGGRWLPQHTFVERLMEKRPDVFKVAAANEDAMNALWKAGENDPERSNMARMLDTGWAVLRYAYEHDQSFPDGIDVLFEKEYLKPPFEAKSLVTGRPYIYVAAGEKQPAKSSDAAQVVLLYDDNECQGWYQCISAAGVGTSIRVDELKKRLKKRDK